MVAGRWLPDPTGQVLGIYRTGRGARPYRAGALEIVATTVAWAPHAFCAELSIPRMEGRSRATLHGGLGPACLRDRTVLSPDSSTEGETGQCRHGCQRDARVCPGSVRWRCVPDGRRSQPRSWARLQRPRSARGGRDVTVIAAVFLATVGQLAVAAQAHRAGPTSSTPAFHTLRGLPSCRDRAAESLRTRLGRGVRTQPGFAARVGGSGSQNRRQRSLSDALHDIMFMLRAGPGARRLRASGFLEPQQPSEMRTSVTAAFTVAAGFSAAVRCCCRCSKKRKQADI